MELLHLNYCSQECSHALALCPAQVLVVQGWPRSMYRICLPGLIEGALREVSMPHNLLVLEALSSGDLAFIWLWVRISTEQQCRNGEAIALLGSHG